MMFTLIFYMSCTLIVIKKMKVELFQYEIFEPPVKFPYNKAMNA